MDLILSEADYATTCQIKEREIRNSNNLHDCWNHLDSFK